METRIKHVVKFSYEDEYLDIQYQNLATFDKKDDAQAYLDALLVKHPDLKWSVRLDTQAETVSNTPDDWIRVQVVEMNVFQYDDDNPGTNQYNDPRDILVPSNGTDGKSLSNPECTAVFHMNGENDWETYTDLDSFIVAAWELLQSDREAHGHGEFVAEIVYTHDNPVNLDGLRTAIQDKLLAMHQK